MVNNMSLSAQQKFLTGGSNPVHIPATNQGIICGFFIKKNPASSSTYIIRERKFPGLQFNTMQR